MATNIEFSDVAHLTVIASHPTTPTSGDPCVMGQIPGVALIDEDSDGQVVIAREGVFNLAVVGADGSGNAAVSRGDILYYDAGEVNKDVTNGVRFGYAMDPVSSGATTTIRVLLGY